MRPKHPAITIKLLLILLHTYLLKISLSVCNRPSPVYRDKDSANNILFLYVFDSSNCLQAQSLAAPVCMSPVTLSVTG